LNDNVTYSNTELESAFAQSIDKYAQKMVQPVPVQKSINDYEPLIKLVLIVAILNIPGYLLSLAFGTVAFVIWFVAVMVLWAGNQIMKVLNFQPKESVETTAKNKEIFHAIISNEWASRIAASMQFKVGATPSAETLNASRLWNESKKIPLCDGVFEGTVNKQKIQCFELDLKKYDRIHDQPFFSGLFLTASCPRAAEANFIIRKDTLERGLGVIGLKLQTIGANKESVMRIDNKVFEDLFIAKSSSPEISMQLLSPPFIELLIALRLKAGDEVVSCSLSNGIFYMSIKNILPTFHLTRPETMQSNFPEALDLRKTIHDFMMMAKEINR
jgi:hypothetical protein